MINNNKSCWEKNAKRYDKIIDKDKVAYEKISCEIAKYVKHQNVLEVGTGTGSIAFSIMSNTDNYLATDFSEEMIKIARIKAKENFGKQMSRIKFEVADATKLPYADNQFDSAIISNCLHIMPNPEKAICELRRVVKSNGMIFAPNFCSGNMISAKIFGALGKIIGFKTFNEWTVDEYHNFIKRNGLNIIAAKTYKSSFPIELVISKNMN